jgi:hypothetical protein
MLTVREDAKNSKCTGRENTSKKRHLAAFVFVPSVFGELNI